MPDLRFLFFLYYYPPALGTAAKRNFRISTAIARMASRSFIFTSSLKTQSPAQPENTSVKHISAMDYRSLLRRRTRDGSLPETAKKGPVAQWLIRLINTFPINILAGEGGLVYFINLLVQGNKAIRENKITHLYSSYRPFADHYAACLLKRRNPQVYWIADFRDLVIDPHYRHIIFPGAHQSFFKKIFRQADLLTTVSDGLSEHLRAYNPNVLTLRNGIEKDVRPVLPVPSPVFSIAYTGSMFLDKRNAEPLFLALQELFQDLQLEPADIRIVYAGKDGVYWKDLAARYRFESILVDKGIVDAPEAIRIQQEACINILLTVSSEELQGVLTGKMIEYFESGSPVLGIVVGRNDPEIQSMLLELAIGNSYTDHEENTGAIKAFILHEYFLWKETGMNHKPVDLDILRRKYAMDAVMKPLFDRLQL